MLEITRNYNTCIIWLFLVNFIRHSPVYFLISVGNYFVEPFHTAVGRQLWAHWFFLCAVYEYICPNMVIQFWDAGLITTHQFHSRKCETCSSLCSTSTEIDTNPMFDPKFKLHWELKTIMIICQIATYCRKKTSKHEDMMVTCMICCP